MNVKEMHIQVEQSLQQVAAARTRGYEPEELDLYLNKIQDRVIESKLIPNPDGTGGYRILESDLDMLRTLVVSGYELTPYIDGTKSRYKCYLPFDYAFLLADNSSSLLLCDATATETTESLYITAIKQKYTAKSEALYYETLALAGPVSLSLPADLSLTNTYTGYRAKKDIMFLIPFIAGKKGLWWENFGDVSFQDSYLYVNKTGLASFTMALDGTNAASIIATQTLSLKKHTNTATGTVENRLLSSAVASKYRNNPIYKTAHYSPISELSGNLLYVYYDNSFIISKVTINYIRKPLPISLSLGTNSELPDRFHGKLCELVVEAIKVDLQNTQGQQLKQNEIQTRVII